ncbi:DoxX family protein [Candidatus Nomurabacteria bacterium]|nr:DoxX family protein [Candidatus Kaiserbacteria bacterium]MCB9810190.1 DoxX family protein [Candidatus Nomurabacteria bacterium]MCB9818235.1 DoxX family protein [Candidatus Nomurabacteria bacterium]
MLMLNAPQRDLLRDKGTTLGRALIGFLFFMSGVGIVLGGPSNTATYFTTLGIPVAGLLVWLVVIVKVVAGGAVMIGKRVGLASAVLIGFTFLATIIGHAGMSNMAPFDLTAILKNLAIIGGLLYLMAYGPGGSNTKFAPTNDDKNGDGMPDVM